MARTTTFQISEGGINQLFHEPGGDVHDHMQSLGRRMVFIAKREVGVDTKATQTSIMSRILRAPGACVLEVEATSQAALYHHEGTRPHAILPRRARALRFKQGGRVVYARRVFHPGTRPNPYLMTALREVLQ